MKRIAFILCLILVFTVSAQNPKIAELDSLFDHYQKNDAFFGNVLLKKDGEILYERSVGYQNLENNKKNTLNSLFLIGSITKTYTATLILQLAEENKLNLSDKLARYYPEIPNADKIDIEMLLRHRSGLFNYTNEEGFIENVSQPISKESFLKKVKGYEIVFEPDAQYEYSNTNYMLLGYIIEDASGNSYKKQLEEEILGKLGLKNTYLGRPLDKTHFAKSYLRKGDKWEPTVPEWNTDWAWSAGALAATLEDLAVFYEALFSGKLIAQESLEKMLDIKEGYGYGITSFPFNDKKFYGHSGGIESYRSTVGYNKEDGVLLVQFVNATNYFNPNDISIQLLNGVYGKPLDFPDFSRRPVEVDGVVLKGYEGVYDNPEFPLDIKVYIKDNELYGQATGQGAFPLTPYSNTEFEFKPAGIKMSFYKKDGKQLFLFKQGNIKFDFIRK